MARWSRCEARPSSLGTSRTCMARLARLWEAVFLSSEGLDTAPHSFLAHTCEVSGVLVQTQLSTGAPSDPAHSSHYLRKRGRGPRAHCR